MKFLNSNYEKLILVLVVLLLVIVVVGSFFKPVKLTSKERYLKPASFSFESLGGEEALILAKETELLPNDNINIYNPSGELMASVKIKKVIFRKKSKVSIQLKSKTLLKGRLLNPSNTILAIGWEKSRSPLVIDTDDGVSNISFEKIVSIRGEQKLILDKPLGKFDPSGCIISTYQTKNQFLSDANRSERSRWTNNSTEENSSIYDLFTPPIIYLVDGALSTTLPKAPQEKIKEEPFGLSLISFIKEKYRFKMGGWIGETPYFEDLQKKVSLNSKVNIRNRIEVNIPYKLNPNYKPGLSSLTKTTTEDKDKLLIVEYFAVQQIPNQKTGGLKSVGRAMVKDFQIGGKAFEINSLMEEVYTDQYSILLRYELKGEVSKEITISEKEIGKNITFRDRSYQILEIDSNEKKVIIQKTGPVPSGISETTLTLP